MMLKDRSSELASKSIVGGAQMYVFASPLPNLGASAAFYMEHATTPHRHYPLLLDNIEGEPRLPNCSF